MTEHRYPCQAVAPELPGWSNEDLYVSGHKHACIHDALHEPKHPVVEHRCECSMTWTERVEMPRTSKDVFIDYLASTNEYAASTRKSNKRLAIGMLGMFTLVGLICVGALAGQGLGWWS